MAERAIKSTDVRPNNDKNRTARSLNSRSGYFCRGKVDLTFLFLVLGILTTGLIMLFSASAPYASTYYGDSYYFIKRQLIFAVAGVVIMFVVSKFNYHVLKKFAWILYAISILMLVAVLFLPEVVPGFKRWLGIGPITFQPSEVAKFSLVLLLAYLISKNYEKMIELKFIAKLFVIIGTFAGLVIAEKHLSATILISIIALVILVAGGMQFRYVLFLGAAGVGGAAIAIMSGLIDYGMDRIIYWLDPWADATDTGYQTIQSLLAIGSGGVTGQGIGQSTQKYLWVPEPQNDFIFAIVCEELGLFGAVLIIAAFALLVWRGLVIAMRAPDKFGALLTLGLIFQVGLQTVLNMLVVTNTIPNTGISLPFFSYGGTSLMMLLFQMGVILSVSRQANMQKV